MLIWSPYDSSFVRFVPDVIIHVFPCSWLHMPFSPLLEYQCFWNSEINLEEFYWIPSFWVYLLFSLKFSRCSLFTITVLIWNTPDAQPIIQTQHILWLGNSVSDNSHALDYNHGPRFTVTLLPPIFPLPALNTPTPMSENTLRFLHYLNSTFSQVLRWPSVTCGCQPTLSLFVAQSFLKPVFFLLVLLFFAVAISFWGYKVWFKCLCRLLNSSCQIKEYAEWPG